MTQPDEIPLDQNFRPRSDHGLNLPEGTVVLSAKFGRVRADIWHDKEPRKIWSEDTPPNLIAELDHPVWRISAGYGSIAVTEKVARFRAEEIARDIYGMTSDPDLFTNKATREEIDEDRKRLGLQNAEAIRIRNELRSAEKTIDTTEPDF